MSLGCVAPYRKMEVAGVAASNDGAMNEMSVPRSKRSSVRRNPDFFRCMQTWKEDEAISGLLKAPGSCSSRLFRVKAKLRAVVQVVVGWLFQPSPTNVEICMYLVYARII